jgi:hypothetical protein
MGKVPPKKKQSFLSTFKVSSARCFRCFSLPKSHLCVRG